MGMFDAFWDSQGNSRTISTMFLRFDILLQSDEASDGATHKTQNTFYLWLFRVCMPFVVNFSDARCSFPLTSACRICFVALSCLYNTTPLTRVMKHGAKMPAIEGKTAGMTRGNCMAYCARDSPTFKYFGEHTHHDEECVSQTRTKTSSLVRATELMNLWN